MGYRQLYEPPPAGATRAVVRSRAGGLTVRVGGPRSRGIQAAMMRPGCGRGAKRVIDDGLYAWVAQISGAGQGDNVCRNGTGGTAATACAVSHPMSSASSSREIPACRRIECSVPMRSSVCMGTMTVRPDPSRNFTCDPFWPTNSKPFLLRPRTTSAPDHVALTGCSQRQPHVCDPSAVDLPLCVSA